MANSTPPAYDRPRDGQSTNSRQHIFTSESVTEGHPDKVCDYIADSILDAHLAGDPHSRVACEALCKDNLVVVAGEITSRHEINYEQVVREAIKEIGYTDLAEPFCAHSITFLRRLSAQAPEISQGVSAATDTSHDQGAGDQGMTFGFATSESVELLPLPIVLAHRITRGLAEARRSGLIPWLRPDGKSQVSVLYEDHEPKAVTDIVVSTQHAAYIQQDEIRAWVADSLLPRCLGEWYTSSIRLRVNPAGPFTQGGPSADCGVTGRKIIVDSYGGWGRHGGGAFSGKDPSKVDRSGAYFGRFVARQLVTKGLARRAEIQVAYAIGEAKPVSVRVDTFGTGDTAAAEEFVRGFDFRPAAIIERLELLRPIYRKTTNYGHFGKAGLSWEG